MTMNSNYKIEYHNEIPNLVYTDGTKKIYFHSRHNPQQEVERLLKYEDIQEQDLIILFGLGAGYILEHLSCILKNDVNIIIVEKDIEVINLIKTIYTGKFLKNKTIYTTKNIDNLYTQFNQLNLKNYRKINFLYQPVEKKLFHDFYSDVYQKLNEIIDSFVSKSITLSKFAKLFYENFFKNLKFLIIDYNIKTLMKNFKDKPAMLIAAGPSLNDNIEYIKSIQNYTYIFAVDTVIDGLIASDIEPDFVVTLDPQPISANHFKNSNYDNITLIYECTASYTIPDKFKNRFYVSTGFPAATFISDFLDNYFIFKNSGGSVATLAFDIIDEFGFNPIILVGQDLSVKESLHTKYSSYYLESLKILNKYTTIETLNFKNILEKKLIPVKGNNGTVNTTYSLLEYLKWFNTKIKNLKSKKIYNTSINGAYINNTIVKPLSEIINLLTEKLDKKIFIKPKELDNSILKNIILIFENALIEFKNLVLNCQNSEIKLNEILNKKEKTLDLLKILLYKKENVYWQSKKEAIILAIDELLDLLKEIKYK